MKKLIAILSMFALLAVAGGAGAQDKDKAPEKPAAEATKADPAKADAVLTGAVVNFVYFPTTYDTAQGRSTGVQAVVTLRLALTDRATNTAIFNRPGAEFRERYEISENPQQYFDESGTAMIRLSQDVARSVVSAILENF